MTTLVEEKIYCPYCGTPLPIRVEDSRRFMPVVLKKGDFELLCHSKTCKNRIIGIDIVIGILID